MFTPTLLTLIIHVDVWLVGVYTHTPIVLTLIIHVEVGVVGLYTHAPTVLTLIIHVEVWVAGAYTHTPIVLTLIIHVEVGVVGVYIHCTYTDHTCRGLGSHCLLLFVYTGWSGVYTCWCQSKREKPPDWSSSDKCWNIDSRSSQNLLIYHLLHRSPSFS